MMEPYKGNPGAPRDYFIGPEEGLALDEMMLIEDYEHTSCDILGNSTKQGDRRVDLHPNSRQHRNRIAQRKFRERQKDKILQMEETIAHQNAKISQLQAENDLLTNRCLWQRTLPVVAWISFTGYTTHCLVTLVSLPTQSVQPSHTVRFDRRGWSRIPTNVQRVISSFTE